MVVALEAFIALGRSLFGENREEWRFVCPACGNVASIKLAQEKWPEVEGKGWRPVSECIGRYTKKVDCDWAAYGLIAGPLKIQLSVGTSDETSFWAFDYDGLPFTKDNPMFP